MARATHGPAEARDSDGLARLALSSLQRPQFARPLRSSRGHRRLDGRSIDVTRTGPTEEHAKEPLQDEHQLTFGASEVQDVDERQPALPSRPLTFILPFSMIAYVTEMVAMLPLSK